MAFNLLEPRIDFLDPRTGKISRQWYLFFQTLYTRSMDSTTETALELILSQPAGDQAGLDAAIQSAYDELRMLPVSQSEPVDRVAQLETQLVELQSQLAELTKEVAAIRIDPSL